MVKLLMEPFEILPRELGNHSRVPPRVHSVSVVRKERLLARAAMDGIRRGVHTLHLIKHHTLVSEGLGLILNIVMPALLLERPWRQSWVQHRVEINIDQIVEVFQVLAGNRVAGTIRIGEGVEESVHRALEKLDEWLFDRIFARSAQDTVLENVRNACRVVGGRAESNAKHLVLVRHRDRHYFRASFLMSKENHLRTILLNDVLLDVLELVHDGRLLDVLKNVSRHHLYV
mmetsp:Transcript_27673/g.44531  ORF Transcript_27673/g.44531 Transcript_27673/m.44531 type:complete len:230 (+) Transcript_27673:2358-3047(+)